MRLGERQSKHVFISAGEPSGDLHAANLARALKALDPDLRISGFGGPLLAEAGGEVLYPLVQLAVMWFGRVIQNFRLFLKILRQAEDFFRTERPDVVVLIDYPGLHWHLARRARECGIPVVYFVPPQIWAWAPWRVAKVRRSINEVLCSLPFEPEWYHQRNVPNAKYIGHPYFDELHERPIDDNFVRKQHNKIGDVVALLPGSRTQEVTRNLPTMIRAAALLHAKIPQTRFLVCCLHERHADLARGILQKLGDKLPSDLPLEIHAARTPEILKVARCAWAVSGSVSLELLWETIPSVVIYKVKRVDLWIARRFIRSKYISLVNLLADDELFPEYLTSREISGDLAEWGRTWLTDEAAYEGQRARLAELRDRVAAPGATQRAAKAVMQWVEADANVSRPVYPSPHLNVIATTPGISAPQRSE